MLKVFIIIGYICVPTFECLKFEPEQNVQYLDKKTCMKDGKKLGDRMYKRMTEKKIPTNIYVYCKEVEKWQAT
jgi:hypothetical protein|tara:strand:+ start:107 stop:325 length:219 start_codon:yes stop_codon:yes gene_type:complete